MTQDAILILYQICYSPAYTKAPILLLSLGGTHLASMAWVQGTMGPCNRDNPFLGGGKYSRTIKKAFTLASRVRFVTKFI
jgi:hypothetical protein